MGVFVLFRANVHAFVCVFVRECVCVRACGRIFVCVRVGVRVCA